MYMKVIHAAVKEMILMFKILLSSMIMSNVRRHTVINYHVQSPRYPFDAEPEATRPYISFQPRERILVEKRHDCGWWYGSVIQDEQHGNLGPKGYFPGNYCQAPAQPVGGGSPQTAST